MRIIGEENKNQTISDERAMKVYESDKAAFNDFVSGRKGTIDFSHIQRLVTSELILNKSFGYKKVLGFTRDQIKRIVEHPERYGLKILELMEYIYHKSGYLRRMVDYFSHMPKLNFYVDTEITSPDFFKDVKSDTLKRDYINFCAEASKYNLSNVVHEIFKRLYLHDVCYAFVIETAYDISYFFLDPRFCKLRGIVNGNVFRFAINRSLLDDSYIESLPFELQQLLEQSKITSKNNLVDVPIENSLCIKYNSNFMHIYPILFSMIPGILLIDDYEDLAKTKAINDAYKLLVLHVPTKDGEITMDDPTLSPFVKTALGVVNSNIGVLPYPGDVTDIEFSSSSSDDNDIVSDVTSQVYAEQGVSEALMSGATSGSELKLSITNDSGDIFRLYRMLENWVMLRMKMMGHVHRNYQFLYKIMDITIFNTTDVVDQELKLAQASVPNKSRLCAAAGMSPTAMLGNGIIENDIFKDEFDKWIPLKSSYTSASTDEDVGAPSKDDGDLSAAGEVTRENDTNNPDNRI